MVEAEWVKKQLATCFKNAFGWSEDESSLPIDIVSGSVFTKEDMEFAFNAGDNYANDCKCGECHYCTETKDKDAPSFNEWIKHYR